MKSLLYLIIFIIFTSSNSYSNIITNLTLKEKEGITTNNYPLTFGHVFKKGDVDQYISAIYNGIQLQTQCDIKTRYDDGSVKFAIISIILPSIKSASINSISLSTASLTNSDKFMDKPSILATNIEDEIRLTNLSGSGYSGSLTADLNAKISSDSLPTYWLRGSVATEILVQQGLNNSLEAAWEVRYYPGTSFGPRISHSIENINANYRGIVNYDVNIQAGLPALSSRYTKSSVQHNENSRWRKVLWIGNKPPETELHYDISYIISTGSIMNYDTTIIVPESIITSTYSTWQSSSHDIMENGIVEKYFPGTGGRDDIGILPAWTARYLLSMDNRMKEVAINCAEMGGHAPIHFRENNSSKGAYRHPISIDDRPTVWTSDEDDRASSFGNSTDKLPVKIGSVGSAYHSWKIDVAHQPSLALVPYIITGDHYFLRELQYWAAYNLSACDADNGYGRQGAKGIINPDPREIRGVAWALRTIGDAASFSADDDIEKSYFAKKIENNFDYLFSIRETYPLRHIYSNELHEDLSATVQRSTSPWMDDFVLLSVSHLYELGFINAEQKVIDWYAEFIIGRFTNPDFNHYNACPYRFPAVLTNSNKVQTWAQASALFLNQPTSFPTVTTGTSIDDYRFVALAALSVVDKYISGEKGLTARNWLLNQIKNTAYDTLISGNPKWSIMPRLDLPSTSSKNSPVIFKIN